MIERVLMTNEDISTLNKIVGKRLQPDPDVVLVAVRLDELLAQGIDVVKELKQNNTTPSDAYDLLSEFHRKLTYLVGHMKVKSGKINESSDK